MKIENTPFLVLPPKASDGFLKTGDLATIDAGGYCTITGRQKDTIIRGGENIAPSEVEAVLRRHRSVFDVSLVGVRQLRHNCCPLHASRSSAPPRTPHVACATCAHSHWCPDADHAWPAIRCHARFTVLDLGLVHVMLDSRFLTWALFMSSGQRCCTRRGAVRMHHPPRGGRACRGHCRVSA